MRNKLSTLLMLVLLAQPVAAREQPETNISDVPPLMTEGMLSPLMAQILEEAADCREFAELAVELGDPKSLIEFWTCID